MKIEQFKKAAKRLSKSEKIELNEAQEKLSSYFGFKNFSAAVKALSPVDTASIGPGVSDTVQKTLSKFWCDLTLQEFKLLVQLIIKKNHPQGSLMTEPGQWRQKGIQMFDAAIQGVVAINLHEGKSLNTNDLYGAIKLNRIEDMYLACWQAAKSENPDALWKREVRKITAYLESGCPGYRVEKLLKQNGLIDNRGDVLTPPAGKSLGQAFLQESIAIDQHGYRVDQASNAILSSLEAVELRGGVSQLSLYLKPSHRHVSKASFSIGPTRVGNSDLDFYSQEKITILDFLRFLVSEKRMPYSFEYDAFTTSFNALEEIEVFGD